MVVLEIVAMPGMRHLMGRLTREDGARRSSNNFHEIASTSNSFHIEEEEDACVLVRAGFDGC